MHFNTVQRTLRFYESYTCRLNLRSFTHQNSMSRPKPTLWILRKVTTRISQSMPRIDTFLFQESLLYTFIPHNYAEAKMLVFSRDGSYRFYFNENFVLCFVSQRKINVITCLVAKTWVISSNIYTILYI